MRYTTELPTKFPMADPATMILPAVSHITNRAVMDGNMEVVLQYRRA